MGVEQYLICISHKHYEKQLQLQTVELKVAMDCDGCELKVNKALSSLRGISLSLSSFFFRWFVYTYLNHLSHWEVLLQRL